MSLVVIFKAIKKNLRSLCKLSEIRLSVKFFAKIKANMFNHQGVLNNLKAMINSVDFNIQNMNIEKKDGDIDYIFIY